MSRVHFPVTALGYGCRVGVWFQGCSIRCLGCINPDTWDFAKGWEVTVEDLLTLIGRWLPAADGISITGGEPFDQPTGLRLLVQSLRAQFDGDLLVFSGYTYDELFAKHRSVIRSIDVLITGPFDPAAGQSLYLRGSDNQRISLLSPKARSRYPADIDSRCWKDPRRLDFFFDGGDAFMAGIPKSGFFNDLTTRLESASLLSNRRRNQESKTKHLSPQNFYE